MRIGERLGPVVAALLMALAAPAAAEDGVPSPEDILAMEIEDLLDLEVTTIIKAPRKLSEIAAAVTVLEGEEVWRSGHTSLAEALRMVPGFHVAHIDANKWSVSSRGFAGRFTDKLLVLIDGRSVYTPLFAGVFWDVQDVFLADLSRIEVIRGPGATLWGANAVNGVVNVVTKDARETQGLLLYGGGGVGEQGFGGLRYGGRHDDDTWYRVYLKAFARDDFADATGADTSDDWWQARGGFRVDSDVNPDDTLTVQGEAYTGKSGERVTTPTFTPPYSETRDGEEEVAGGFVLGRWRRDVGEGSDWELQAYFDRTERNAILIGEERNTFDVDFQFRMVPAPRHSLLVGAGYRVTSDRIRNTPAITFDPSGRTDHLVHAFVQDEITLCDGRVIATLGTKIEHNDYTGFEIQPGARVLWKPSERRSVWAAITRAVRTPSRADEDVTITAAVFDPGTGPIAGKFFGNRGLESEELLSMEMGYRTRPRSGLFVDVAAFFNVYANLRNSEPGAPFADGPPPHTTVPSTFMNRVEGEVYGLETTVTWQANERLRLEGGYSFLRMALEQDASSTDTDGEAAEGRSPRNMAHARAAVDLGRGWEADVGLYYVDSLPDMGIPSYVRLDARVGWRPDERTLVELIVRNVLDDRHPEFREELPFTQPTEAEIAAFLRFSRRW